MSAHPTALTDDQAEHHLAGVATITQAGAHQAIERTGPDHFHDPIAWAVIEAAAQIPDNPDPGRPDPIAARIEAIAGPAGIYLDELREWVECTPSMWDSGGHLATRVLNAAATRRTAHRHIAALEAIGFTIRWTR